MRYRIQLLVTLAVVAGLIYAASFAQDRPGAVASKDDQAIRDATDAYVAAFNKGDVDAVVAMWADDAEYVDEAGKSTKGKTALTAMFKNAFNENKNFKVQIKTGAIHFLKLDVAMQDGVATLTQPNGDTENSPFSAAWVKKDGKWQLQLVRELSNEEVAAKDNGEAQLKNLAWLIGNWSYEEKETKTSVSAQWIKGGHFLKLDYSVVSGSEERLSLTQIIGWDPAQEKLHSWVFDSRGGFGEGLWNRDGKTWTVDIVGITMGGLRGSGTNKWTLINDDSFSFHGIGRVLDGQPLPDVDITYRRVKNAK
jgi:uncharacterized protein (TIGR02246 family)